MIRVNSEVSEKERLTAGLVAASIGFHSYEHGVDLSQRLGIVALQDPAFLGSAILIENAEVEVC